MNPFDHITTSLTGRSPWPFAALTEPSEERKTNKTECMRGFLRLNGGATANELAEVADVPCTGLVGALLKGDLARGSVFLRGQKYQWNHQFDAELERELQIAARLLRRHGYLVKKKA